MKQKFNSVWDAIEDDPIKAENLKIRSSLMNDVVSELDKVADSQQEAADLLAITQPRVSALKQGRINDFRLDMLVDFALRLGLEVTIKVTA